MKAEEEKFYEENPNTFGKLDINHAITKPVSELANKLSKFHPL